MQGCSEATPIIVGSLTSATFGPYQLPLSPIGCNDSPTSPSAPAVWFKTVGNGKTFVVSTCQEDSSGSADFDTQLAVYTSCDIIEVNSDACAGQTIIGGCLGIPGSTVSWPTVVDEEYFILVTGVDGASGAFNLEFFDDRSVVFL